MSQETFRKLRQMLMEKLDVCQELTDQEHALTAKASKNIFFLHIIQPPCPS